MDGPTLTPRYNALIEFWKSVGEPMPPECELCSKDVTGMKVVETSMGFICTHCDKDLSGKPTIKANPTWPMKGVFR